jgi:type I restriction enzyme S subunit
MSHYKPYPAYKDSGVEWIGKVPEGWGVAPICRVASCNDDSLSENVQPDQMLRYVDISSVNHTDGIAEVAEIRFADAPSRARRRAKTGDVVISTVRTYLKAVAAVTETHADCTYSTGFAVLRPRPSEVEPAFLKWLTLNDLVIQAIESHSEGLSYPAINATDLVKIKAVIPPRTEQTAIAAALDRETARIDALISRKTRFIELLKEKRQALITHAVTKGLDPNVKMKDSGVEWIGEVPEGWSVRPIKGIVSTPITDGPHETPQFYGHGVPFVSAEAISGGFLNFEKIRGYISMEAHEAYSKKYKPQKNDIFMIKSGATTGVTAIVDTDIEFNIWSPLAVIRCDDVMDPFFVLNYMRSFSFQEGVSQNWSFGTQQNIGMGVIGNLHVTAPPLAEQRSIATYLKNGTAKIGSLAQKTQRSIDLLKERRSAFITAAVTGQIDLRVAA